MDSFLPQSLRLLLNHELLTPAEERILGRKARKGDLVARDRLVRCNARLVYKLTRKYARKPEQIAEFFSAGLVGLVRAANGFDPDKKGIITARFSIYAAFSIRQEMQNFMRQQLLGVGVITTGAAKIFGQVTALRRQYPDIENAELAERLGVTVEKVVALESVAAGCSFDASLTEGGANHHDFIAADDPSASDAAEEADLRKKLMEAVETLPAIHADIIKRRYGIGGGDEETLQKIGERYGITRERVRQIEALAFRAIRMKAARKTETFSELAA